MSVGGLRARTRNLIGPFKCVWPNYCRAPLGVVRSVRAGEVTKQFDRRSSNARTIKLNQALSITMIRFRIPLVLVGGGGCLCRL